MTFQLEGSEIAQRLVKLAGDAKKARVWDGPQPKLTERDEIALREAAAIVALAYDHLSGKAAE